MLSLQQKANQISLRSPLPVALLSADPVLKHVEKIELARLSIHLYRLIISRGQRLVSASAPAEQTFLIEKGTLELKDAYGRKNRTASGFVGIAAAIGLPQHEEDITAIEDTTVIVFRRQHMQHLLANNADIHQLFLQLYAQRYKKSHLENLGFRKTANNDHHEKKNDNTIHIIIGWITVMALPVALYLVVSPMMNVRAAYFAAIVTAALLMWFFQLLPGFVPPLISLLLFILLDVAPTRIILSGFSSDSFFMCMSIFGIGALMINSGLIYRLILHTLARVPASKRWYSATLFLSGLVQTPFVPSPEARAALTSPFLGELLSFSHPERKDLSTLFFNSTLYGICITGTIFLTGKPTNLAILAMLDEQTQYAFQWTHWLLAASVAGAFMIVFYIFWSHIFFKGTGNVRISRKKVAVQIQILGPVSPLEWSALISVACMSVGIVTATVHKIEIPWIVLSIIVALLLFGVLGAGEIRSYIDWSMLILIGGLGAWEDLVTFTGINEIISDYFHFIGYLMTSNLYVFVGLLYGVIMAVRFILPVGITTIVFITALLPISTSTGISQWFIAFVVLFMAETFVFPYQDGEYANLKEELESQGSTVAYDNRSIIRFNAIMAIVRLGAIYASIWFWRHYLHII